ncbi:MAG: substrate-binding domain-containing protein [Synergistaceae bacterium]|jgi:phosphate transport system substrate-binding protein|nr:substrate-binding domain-containing protein [Synergistaceae bacterium]
MKNKWYYIIMGFMSFVGFPVIVDLTALLGLFVGSVTKSGVVAFLISSLPVMAVSLILWRLYVKRVGFPDTAFKRLLPVFAAFFYYMGAWVLIFGMAHYRFNSELFVIYHMVSLPYFVITIILAFDGSFNLFPVIHTAVLLINLIAYQVVCLLKRRGVKFDRRVVFCVAASAALCAIAAYQRYESVFEVISGGGAEERVSDEVDLSQYYPFAEGNYLQVPDEPPVIGIEADYPRLDGATAAYPVYGAAAQAIYKGLDEEAAWKYVSCSKTIRAYERLIDGDIDIFFGAQPSRQQVEAARERGVEFNLTPIAKEAFVFFVNRENAVSGLTIGQIQDIYQKKISNWRKLGGANERIIPFQRPENSGSQTVMAFRVMGGKELPLPVWEEYASGMGGIVSRVAEYRNYSSAIGYSFRYFAIGMKPNENIKLIAVDGVEPTVENIRSGEYPFTVDVYAVTAGPPRGNSRKLIDWFLSDQGQAFIEQCGYVGLRP